MHPLYPKLLEMNANLCFIRIVTAKICCKGLGNTHSKRKPALTAGLNLEKNVLLNSYLLAYKERQGRFHLYYL
jgi:hypothetical protein